MTITVSSGVVSRGVHIGSGDELVVNRGGEADSSVISGSGGVGESPAAMIIAGVARNTLLSAGGTAGVKSGGLAYRTTVDGKSSILEVSKGGEASGTILNAGQMAIGNDGNATGTIVSSGGGENIEWGGSATGTTVLSDGDQGLVGGVSHRTIVNSGGEQYVNWGTTASTTLRNGGTEMLQGGRSVATNILSGAEEVLWGGAAASGSLISSGGQEIVSSGGVAAATQIFKGGVLMVSSGGAISGGLVFHAGSAIVDGSVGAGTVRFAGVAGLLDLNDVADFHAAISGFKGAAEKIDIGGFGFLEGETVSWKQMGTSGTLTVKGDEIAKLTLIGQYTASDFKLANDFHDGTYLTYQPATPATAPARLAQAMAGLSGRDGALAIHSGGAAVMSQPLIAGVTSGR